MNLTEHRLRGACILVAAATLAVAAPALAADNLPPVNAVPATQTIDEDVQLTFSAPNLNQISVADPDAGTDDLRVVLTAVHGTMTLATTSGLSFAGEPNGDNGIDDPEIGMTGTLAELNAALDGMVLTPELHHNDTLGHGGASLTVDTNDLGHNGDPPAESDNDMIAINVDPLPDPPIHSIPAGVGTFRDVPRELSLDNLNSITVKDPDTDSTVMMEMELTSTGGTMTLQSTTGLTLQSGANGSASMTFQGTDASFTGALNDGLTFTPDPGFTGNATVTAESTDFGPSAPDVDVAGIRVDAPGEMIFWTAAKETVPFIPGSLGRAFLDGSGGANLLTGPELMDTPATVAIDAAEGRIYWANTGASDVDDRGIWSATLEGNDKHLFLAEASPPSGASLDIAGGIVIDQSTRRLYWADNGVAKGIYYASLDDADSGGQVDTTGAATTSPRAIALDLENQQVYWTNSQSNSIGFAPLPGSVANAGTFTTSTVTSGDGSATINQPVGVAVDQENDRLFWTNGSGDSSNPERRLKVAALNGTTSITSTFFDISPNPGGGLRTPVIDGVANRIYWGSGSDLISFADLNGGGGTNLATGSAFKNSADGVAILKDPEPVGPPSVTGTPETGSTLTCSVAAWAPDQPNAGLYRVPESTGFSWTLDGAPIGGATGATHTPTAAGEYRCIGSATNFAGTNTQESAPVTVTAAPEPVGAKCAGSDATRVGTAGRDVLAGTAGRDVIAGLGGNDTIRGLAGNDVLCGGVGSDRLIGGRGRDRLFGNAGRDTCRGGAKRDRARTCEVRRTI